MFYREAGQFKTSYAADMAIFPILQDRIGHRRRSCSPLSSSCPSRQRIPARLGDDAVSRPRAGDHRAEHPDRLYRSPVARHRCLHGRGCLCLLQAVDGFSGVNILVWIVASGFVSRRCRRAVRPAVAAHQRLLPRVATLAAQFFLQWCFVRIPLALQLQPVRRDRGAAAHACSASPSRARRRRPSRATSSSLTIVAAHHLDRVEHRARPHRAQLHGGPRHGYRGAADGHPAAATKLLAFAVSSFYSGVAGAMMVFLWLGAAEPDAFNINQSFILLFMVIIGGLGSLIGSLPRRGADPHPADRGARAAGLRSACRSAPRPSNI